VPETGLQDLVHFKEDQHGCLDTENYINLNNFLKPQTDFNYLLIFNTFAASYLNTQGLKKFMLKIASVDLSRSNFSIARAPLFQLKSAT